MSDFRDNGACNRWTTTPNFRKIRFKIRFISSQKVSFFMYSNTHTTQPDYDLLQNYGIKKGIHILGDDSDLYDGMESVGEKLVTSWYVNSTMFGIYFVRLGRARVSTPGVPGIVPRVHCRERAFV